MTGKVSNLIRSIAARIHRNVNDRRKTLRRGTRLEARLPLIITPLGIGESSPEYLSDATALVGFTHDLGETGLTLLLPSVRVRDIYLTDMERYLGVRLELPDGPLAMLTVSVRFEQLSRKEAGCSFLLAVRIIRMQNGERDRYISYLRTIESKERIRDRRQAPAAHIGSTSAAQAVTWEALTPASLSKAFEQFARGVKLGRPARERQNHR